MDRLWPPGRAALGLVLLLAACAHRPDQRALEAEYLRSAPGICAAAAPSCCAETEQQARAAERSGQTARAARLWHTVAVGCPARRAHATTAMLAARIPGAPSPGPRPLNVSFRVRLPSDWRLMWLSAEWDGKLLPAMVVGGSAEQPVTVEVHLAHRRRPTERVILRQEFRVADDGRAVAFVEIGERAAPAAGEPPVVMKLQVDRLPPPRPGRPVSAPARPAPRLEPARPIGFAPLRAPAEMALTGAVEVPVRVCLDRVGDHDSARFLVPLHPRLAAAVLDQLRDTLNEPYRVNDAPVPSCHLWKMRL